MDLSWKTAIQQNQCLIVDATDSSDVLLDRCIDFLRSNEKRLLPEMIEEIKECTNSRARMGKLLDFLLTLGPNAFPAFRGAVDYAERGDLVKILEQSYNNLMQAGMESVTQKVVLCNK